jgi:ketosteroid isomerase-like protein
MAPGAPAVTTREGLRAVAEAGFRHRPSIRIEPLEIVVTETWAFARSQVGGTVVIHPTGEVVTVDVKQISIYRRTASGEWRIARLIMNSYS